MNMPTELVVQQDIMQEYYSVLQVLQMGLKGTRVWKNSSSSRYIFLLLK